MRRLWLLAVSCFLPVLLYAQPHLSLSTTSLDLNQGMIVRTGYTPVSSTFAVLDTGNQGAPFSLQTTGTFFTASPSAGVASPGGGTTITVTPVAGLDAGAYSGSIVVTTTGNAVVGTVTVTFNVGFGITLVASPSSLTFNVSAGTVSSMSFTLIGNDLKNLRPFVQGPSWLTVTPTTSSPTYTVIANTTGVAPNQYLGSVTIDCNTDGPCTDPVVAVTINVTAPQGILTVNTSDPVVLSVQEGNSTSGSFSITNSGAGAGSFNVSASSSGNWLSVGAASGSVPAAGSQTVSIIANAANLTAGSYTGSIVVSSSTSGATIRPFSVNLTVTPKPAAQLSVNVSDPVSLSVQAGSSTSSSFSVNNSGSVAGNFTASASSSGNWLSVAPPSGSVAANGSQNVGITANAANLSAGNYSGTITVSNGSSTIRSFGVSLTVTAKPSAQLSVNASNPVSLSVQAGSSTSGSFSINNSGTVAGNFTASASSAGNWLSVAPGSGSVAANGSQNVSITANAASLGAGPYSGTITVSSGGSTILSFGVSLTVTAQPTAQLSVNAPNPVSLSVQAGSSTSGSFSINNSGTVAGNFTASASSAGNWLSVAPGSGSVAANGSQNVGITANAANLAAGPYSGTITVSSGGSTILSFGVSLTVTAQPTAQLSVNAPNPVSLSVQAGSSTSGSFSINNSGTVAGNFTASASSAGNWLSVVPGSGSVAANGSQNVGITANAANLAAGPYSGTITVSSGGSTILSFGVSLTVTAQPTAQLSVNAPNPVSLSVQAGSSTSGSFSINNSGTLAGNFTASASSAGNWLSVAPGSGSVAANGSQNVAITANAANLSAGPYSGTTTVSSGGSTILSFGVSLTVTAQPTAQLSVNASNPLSLSVQAGSSTSGSFSINNSGTVAGNFSIAAVSLGNWLSVAPVSGSVAANGSQSVGITANAANLAAGTYSGSVSVTSGNNTVGSFNVTLTVTAKPGIILDQSSITFTYQSNAGSTACGARSVGVNSSDSSALSFSLSASVQTPSGGSWLKASASKQTTPAAILVSCDPTGLGAGVYSGQVVVSGAVIQVSLVVIKVSQLVSPGTQTFSVQSHSATPVARSIIIDSDDGSPVGLSIATAVSSGGSWLRVDPQSGSTRFAVSLIVDPSGLAAGSYRGTVTLLPDNGGSTLVIDVLVTATTSASLAVDSSAVSFAAKEGDTQTCGTKPVAVTSTVAANVIHFITTAATSTGGPWLSATPANGTTPGTVTIACSPAGLKSGSYSGTVSISSSDFGGSTQTVNVTLLVTAAPSPDTGLSVLSTASYQPRLAAGMIASIFGGNLAAVTDSSASIVLPTLLDDVSVMLRDSANIDRAAPLFFISPGQINFQIPSDTASGSASLRVLRRTQELASTTIQISPTAPGIFTIGNNVVAATAIRVLPDGSQSPVAIFQCATVCSTTPIDLSLGQVYVSLYATGIRNVQPPFVAGCTIGGISVPVLFLGDQRTFPGLDQINIQLTDAVKGLGEADLIFTLDGISSNTVKINIR